MIICGTGHRPDKLGGYSQAVNDALFDLAQKWLENNPQVKGVISGMAQGWDMELAEAALTLGIPLTCAVPFEGQELVWPEAVQIRYRRILEQATNVTYVGTPGFSSKKMNTRNAWMVDRADLVLALYDGGESGGTANCVRYARAKEVRVENLWPDWKARKRDWWDDGKWDQKKTRDDLWGWDQELLQKARDEARKDAEKYKAEHEYEGFGLRPKKKWKMYDSHLDDAFKREDPLFKYMKTKR